MSNAENLFTSKDLYSKECLEPTTMGKTLKMYDGQFTFLADQNLIINKAPAPASSVNNSTMESSRASVHLPSVISRSQKMQRNITHDEFRCPLNFYKRVQNVGYAILLKNEKQQIVFKCFQPGCSFVLRSEGLFLDHMKADHQNAKWLGVCHSCRMKRVNFDRHLKIHDELLHLKEAHIAVENLAKKDQPQLEITAMEIDIWKRRKQPRRVLTKI